MKFLSSKNIKDFERDNLLIVPILSDAKKHWTQNRLSFLYIFELETGNEFCIGINHNDCDPNAVESFLTEDFGQNVFVHHKKFLPGYKRFKESRFVNWIQINKLEDEELPSRITWFHNKFYRLKNVNDCVPIMVWLEHCWEIKTNFLKHYSVFKQFECLSEYDKLYNELIQIESNGLWTIDEKFEHTEYNPFTITGRPSNKFLGTNYAGLTKENGERKKFISRFGKNGVLIEYDLMSYHIRLLSKIIGFDFQDDDIYLDLKNRYFPDKPESEIKGLVFKQLYGGVDREFEHIEFFQKVKSFNNTIYTKYKLNTLNTFLFERKVSNKNLPNLPFNKVFNYLMQNFETEYNAQILSQINTLLGPFKSKLVLYTYDSFLIDLCREDGKQLISDIDMVFKSLDLPFRMKFGKNYHEMFV